VPAGTDGVARSAAVCWLPEHFPKIFWQHTAKKEEQGIGKTKKKKEDKKKYHKRTS
jgi:hypothetical protein